MVIEPEGNTENETGEVPREYDPGNWGTRPITVARNWAIGLVAGLLGLGMFKSEFKRICDIGLTPMNGAYLVLFALTGVLLFLWIWATQRELNLLEDWLDPKEYDAPSGLVQTLAIMLIGALLTALLFCSRDPLLYGSIFVPYLIFAVIMGRYTYARIEEAINESKKLLEDNLRHPELHERAEIYKDGVAILESYFVDRPFKILVGCIIIPAIAGLILAICWKVVDAQICGILSYAAFYVTITANEIVLNAWRVSRDNSLRPIAARLRKYRREHNKKE